MAPMMKKEKNRIAGEEFLAANGKRDGVKTTKTGLQYEVLTEGDGENFPHKKQSVTVHYTGTSIEGLVFDSSVERGQPTTFPLNKVIAGWSEGVQLMSAGAKFKFFITSELAYGSNGAGSDIGPNETILFEVELLSLN